MSDGPDDTSAPETEDSHETETDVDDGTTPETHTVNLELADEPGELLRALGPIADNGGNLLTVLHERGNLTPRGRVPVTVEFRCPPARFDDIVDALSTAGVTVAQADSESYADRVTVLLVGHVVERDLSETLLTVEESPVASVVSVSLSAPEGTDDVSAARLTVGVSDGRTAEALAEVRRVATEKGFRLLTPVGATDTDGAVPSPESAHSRRQSSAGTAATDADGSRRRLAVLGAGAVGRAVCRAAPERGHSVVAVADSTGASVDPDGIDVEAALGRKERRGSVGAADPEEALEAPFDILVEATPTTLGDARPGFDHAVHALERDRSVVLANKGPVAERYADLRAAEAASDGRVLFGATVGGAVPVLSTVRDFGATNVRSVRGVLNGTANFVCSRMASEGLAYEHVLAEAQDLGVAEADPSFDVEGTDAALKCVIVANVLSGDEREWTLSDPAVEVEGIADLPVRAFESAAEAGQTVRLVGTATRERVRVAPRLVSQSSPLAVAGTRNVVRVETATAGTIDVGGRGAGGPETAASVLADVDRLAGR